MNDCASRSDGMLAIYPGGGARFQAHVDNTTDDGRRLTVLCYFNEKWHEDHGGALRLHGATGPVDVLPKAGRLACFYSDLMKHEVRPTHRPRASVTLWYYSASERKEAVARAKESEATGRRAPRRRTTSARRRACSREALRPEPGLDDVGESAEGGRGAPERVARDPRRHGRRADFRLALNRLESDDLAKLRGRFAKMGVEQCTLGSRGRLSASALDGLPRRPRCVSSLPPTCVPLMKTEGTVRWPVISASASWMSWPSSRSSSSTAVERISSSVSAFFVFWQKGHQLFEKTTTSDAATVS